MMLTKKLLASTPVPIANPVLFIAPVLSPIHPKSHPGRQRRPDPSPNPRSAPSSAPHLPTCETQRPRFSCCVGPMSAPLWPVIRHLARVHTLALWGARSSGGRGGGERYDYADSVLNTWWEAVRSADVARMILHTPCARCPGIVSIRRSEESTAFAFKNIRQPEKENVQSWLCTHRSRCSTCILIRFN